MKCKSRIHDNYILAVLLIISAIITKGEAAEGTREAVASSIASVKCDGSGDNRVLSYYRTKRGDNFDFNSFVGKLAKFGNVDDYVMQEAAADDGYPATAKAKGASPTQDKQTDDGDPNIEITPSIDLSTKVESNTEKKAPVPQDDITNTTETASTETSKTDSPSDTAVTITSTQTPTTITTTITADRTIETSTSTDSPTKTTSPTKNRKTTSIYEPTEKTETTTSMEPTTTTSPEPIATMITPTEQSTNNDDDFSRKNPEYKLPENNNDVYSVVFYLLGFMFLTIIIIFTFITYKKLSNPRRRTYKGRLADIDNPTISPNALFGSHSTIPDLTYSQESSSPARFFHESSSSNPEIHNIDSHYPPPYSNNSKNMYDDGIVSFYSSIVDPNEQHTKERINNPEHFEYYRE